MRRHWAKIEDRFVENNNEVPAEELGTQESIRRIYVPTLRRTSDCMTRPKKLTPLWELGCWYFVIA